MKTARSLQYWAADALRFLLIFFLPVLAGPIGCSRKPAAPVFTEAELKAEFPEDLGPDKVDVSDYPAEIRKDYDLFVGKCSRCHTAARPLNKDIFTPADWQRYLRRMHVRGAKLGKEEAKRIFDFLAYDTRVRKTGAAAAAFQELRRKNAERFEQVKQEKTRRALAEGKQKPAKEYPYTSP